MTKNVIETAAREGIPFDLKTADGRSYRIDDASRLFIASSHVTWVDNECLAHMLSLLTITGVSYLGKQA
ncbi:MAG: hypothetical protein SFY81_04770 [Verrucomicrobiota bacterium]|nr:hypothetical protein [Verrucomicrobiota bacterium]